MKFVIIGAGSAQFGCGMLGDIFATETFSGAEIALLDINKQALDKVYKYTIDFVEKNKLDFKITFTTDRKEAFKNTDYIISAIEVGDRFKLWDEDWKVPLQYGINQVYGENGGVGGTIHALRIIPPILDIVADMMEICPNAYMFNYSNPMTAICTAVHKKFPKARFIGMCHEIAWLHTWLPEILDKKYEEMDVVAGGLNHFSCLLSLKNKKTGEDLYPTVLKKAGSYFESAIGYSDLWMKAKKENITDDTESWDKSAFKGKKSAYQWADRKLLKFILENYKLLPITVDSHFGEYISWAYDVADHKGISDFYNLYKSTLGIREPKIELKKHEKAVYIIESIVNNKDYREEAVNIANDGYIEGLPSWLAVEVPASVNKDGLRGHELSIPKGFLSLLANYAQAYDLTTEAAITGKKDYAIQALLANPVVNKAKLVHKMLDHLIEENAPWLNYLK